MLPPITITSRQHHECRYKYHLMSLYLYTTHFSSSSFPIQGFIYSLTYPSNYLSICSITYSFFLAKICLASAKHNVKLYPYNSFYQKGPSTVAKTHINDDDNI